MCFIEKCGILNVVLTLVTLVGFVLVAQPSFLFGGFNDALDTQFDSSRVIGVIFALLGAFSAAIVSVIVRKMGPGVHVLLSMMYTAWEGPLFILLYLLASGENPFPCWDSFPYMMASGMCYILSQGLSTIALQREKAGPITLVLSSQVVFSFLLQFIVFGEIPNAFCVVGASLILISCIALGLKSFLKFKKDKKQMIESLQY